MPFHPLSPFTATNLALTFHGIPSAAWFRRALETIGRWYRFVGVDEVRAMFAADSMGNGCCLLTFDDGERSFTEHALPVLEALATPAVLFVSPGVLGGQSNYWFQDLRTVRARMGDEAIRQALAAQTGAPYAAIEGYGVAALLKSLPLAQIRALLDGLAARDGVDLGRRWNLTLEEVRDLDQHRLVTVGAHSLRHPILANETDAAAREEIAGSVQALQALLGRRVDVFAYPNGARGLDFGAREQDMLREQGVALSFATDSGYFGPATDRLAIPRCALSGHESPVEIQMRLLAAPVWDRLRAGREAKERRALRSLVRSAG